MAEDWRLRDEAGNVRSLSAQELRDGLTRGTIPASAWVAREGKEFQPAFSVPDFASIAIRAKRMPSIPPSGSGPSPLRPAPRPGAGRPGGSEGGPDVPPPPRSRRKIAHTLVGIQGDEDVDPTSGAGAPIVAPGAGGAALGAPKAITQVPRYTPAPEQQAPPPDEVVIPRAPRAPQQVTLTATGQGWEESEGSVQDAAGSIFDGEEDSQTLVLHDAPSGARRPPGKPPARPPGPPPRYPEGRRPGSNHPAPMPPRRDGGAGPESGERPPMRNTVMGLGSGGGRGAPRLVAPKAASTPPPASTRPISRPPPAPPLKRTPAPPAAEPKASATTAPWPGTAPSTTASTAGATGSAEAKGAVAAPAAAPAKPATATASAATAGGTPAAGTPIVGASSAATTAPAAASPAPRAPLPSSPRGALDSKASSPKPAPAVEAKAASPKPPAAAAAPVDPAIAAMVTQPTADATPTVPMPEARTASDASARAEGTPTVPMPEARASRPDADDPPTSKMQVQIVHGAALAMRAALAAPHFDATSQGAPTSTSPGSAAGSPATTSSSAAPAEIAPAALPPVAVSRPAETGERDDVDPGPSALPLPPATGVTLRGLGSSEEPPADRSSSSVPPEDDAGPQSGVEVPVSSLFAASAVWIVGLVLVFFVGRCSALETQAEAARKGIAPAARIALLAAAPGTQASAAEPKPCWVTRQPAQWAPQVEKSVPFDMVPSGSAMLVGFARSEDEGIGLRVDPRSGKFERVHEAKSADAIVRVTPLPGKAATDAPTFLASVKGEATVVAVPGADPPLFVRFAKDEIGALAAADAGPTRLFALEGDDRPNAEQVLVAGGEGYYASFRRGDGVMGAWIARDRTARGEVKTVFSPGDAGGQIGKPRAGWNGKQVAVAFAHRPKGATSQIRIARAAGGVVPEASEVFEVPAGGPGGEASAPDVVGLADGRWLVMWTEGSSGKRAIRAMTLGADFAPLGDPIALSPPAGDFGQAQLGVVGGYVTVLFMQRGDEDYELWGAVLQCG